MKLVTVYRTFSAADAQLVRSLLDAAEIPAMVTDELAALSIEGYSMSTGGIRVQVPQEHVEAARELIKAKPEQTD
jgi:hypothetical protein